MRPALLVAAAAALAAGEARAGQIVVYTGGSLLEPVKTVAADFTRDTGNTFSFTGATTGVLLKRIKGGETPDVVVISDEAMKGLKTDGFIAPDSATPIADSILGVAVRAGAPKPDISTPDKFRAAMLAATSVVYPDPALGATSGTYMEGLFRQLGIADQMAKKRMVRPVGAQAVAAVAEGQAEVVLTFVSEMAPDRRVTIVGTLPAPILNPTLYDAGVSTRATDPAAARAFLAFLKRPEEQAKLKAAGVRPVP